LAARGVKVGVLVGTAYLFTEECVSTGAIVPRFQAEALRCQTTVLLETGPGHEVRVGPSPFAESFADSRRHLIAQARPAEEGRAGTDDRGATPRGGQGSRSRGRRRYAAGPRGRGGPVRARRVHAGAGRGPARPRDDHPRRAPRD